MGRLPSLSRQVSALVSAWGHVRGKPRASGDSIGGDFSEDVWVKSNDVALLSWGGCGHVGLLIGEIHRVDLVGLGEDIHGWGNPLKLFPGILLHLLKFDRVFRKFWTVSQACRRVFA